MNTNSRQGIRIITLSLLIILGSVRGINAIGSDSLWISLLECDKANHQIINRQANSLNYSQPDSILIKAEAYLQRDGVKNCDYSIAVLHHMMGRAEMRKTNLPSAMKHFEVALTMYSKIGDSINIVRTLGSLGVIFTEWGRLYESLTYLKQALAISERNKYTSLTSKLLNNLGFAAYRNKNLSLALNYYHSALDYKLQMEDQYGLANTYTNIGEIYIEMNDPVNAWLFINKGLNIRQLLKDEKEIAKSYFSLGKYYYQTGDNQQAVAYVKESLALSRKAKDIYNQAYALAFLGEVYLVINQPKQAIIVWKEAISVCKTVNLSILQIDVYSKLTKQLVADQSFEEATMLFKKKGQLQDSLMTEYQLQAGMHTGQLFSTNKKEQTENHIQNNNLLFIIIGTLSLIILFLSAYISYLSVRRKAILSAKEQELTSTRLQLVEFNQKLEQEVEYRTAALKAEMEERRKVDIQLKKTLKKVEDANFLKNAFLANMSHEIRTPLNGIIGFSSLLETELSLLEHKELYEYASGILESGERLLHLLNNLIDISRLEANDMEVTLTACDISTSINKVAELFRFKANENGIKLNVISSTLPKVLADEKNLMRVLSDLIDNALKYTEKGFINISTGTISDTKEVYIRIKDTGIGIDQSYLPHLFEAFRQESLGYSRAYQGAGLGLPLAKRLIELMRGTIKVESVKAVGTVITITLNQIESVPGQIKMNELVTDQQLVITSKAEVTSGEKHIFIVEDDRMNRLVLQKMLQNTANIEIAIDGEETLQAVKAAYNKGVIFNLMLFDINLPIPWDGTMLMNEIRKNYHEYRNVPFIAQTAYAMSGDRERLLEAGFDDYISKPISKNMLLKTVEKYLIN